MRYISFSLTTPQFLAGTKSVTRRSGWLRLKVGDRLMACEKSRGRKPGEPIVKLGVIEVVNVRREELGRMLKDATYGAEECLKEGYGQESAESFVNFFCRSHRGCTPDSLVTRIEFRKLSSDE